MSNWVRQHYAALPRGPGRVARSRPQASRLSLGRRAPPHSRRRYSPRKCAGPTAAALIWTSLPKYAISNRLPASGLRTDIDRIAGEQSYVTFTPGLTQIDLPAGEITVDASYSLTRHPRSDDTAHPPGSQRFPRHPRAGDRPPSRRLGPPGPRSLTEVLDARLWPGARILPGSSSGRFPNASPPARNSPPASSAIASRIASFAAAGPQGSSPGGHSRMVLLTCYSAKVLQPFIR